MANTITVTTLEEGPRNLVQLVNIVGDGSGDEANRLLVDRSALSGVGSKITVEKLSGLVSGFTAALSFDATTDLVFANLPDGDEFDHCWDGFGGVKSDRAGAGANGDILITTSGLDGNGVATFIMKLRKS